MMAANKQTTTSSRRGAAVRLLLLITTIVMSSHPSTAATTAADAHHPNANDTEEYSSFNVASIIDNNEEAATSSIKKKRKKSRRAEERLYWWPTYSPTTYVPTAWEGDTWLPTKKPTSWSKPTGKPTSWSKPTDKPTSWSKPTGKPTSWSKPTDKPTSWSKPTGKPTSWSKPTGKPTSWSKPTNPPWQSGDKYRIYNMDGNPVGYDTQGWDYHFWWKDKIAAVRGECKAMFDQDSDYVAKAIRLLFHDCKGDSEGYGCDGCVNLDHVDNLGLYGIMQKLSPIVKKNEKYLSRADTWVLCALTALEISTDRFYPMTLIGRHNCKDSNDIGHGGQYHNIYGDEVHTSALFHHFNKYFGFDAKCTVAAMGLHGISTMRPENSGHGNGSNPAKWVRNASQKLSNSYYQGFDYDWTYEVRDNYDQPKFGPKSQWYNGFNSNRVVLLNADVSLKWDFEEYFDPNGNVDCKVSGQDPRNAPPCPVASQTYVIVEDYAENNSLFLNDLKDCMIQMYTTGYRDGYDASYFKYYKDGSTPYPKEWPS